MGEKGQGKGGRVGGEVVVKKDRERVDVSAAKSSYKEK
jgi:hypothetical protein